MGDWCGQVLGCTSEAVRRVCAPQEPRPAMATGSFHSLGETTKWGEVSTPTSRPKQPCVLVMGLFAQQQDRGPTCPRQVLGGACQRSGLVIFQTPRLSVF